MPAQTPPKGWRFPNAFTILIVLIIAMAALTWIIPSGQYTRVPSEALGKDVPVAGTYALTPGNPQGFVDVILAPIAGFYDPDSYAANAIDVALFVLIIGGFIGVVTATGTSLPSASEGTRVYWPDGMTHVRAATAMMSTIRIVKALGKRQPLGGVCAGMKQVFQRQTARRGAAGRSLSDLTGGRDDHFNPTVHRAAIRRGVCGDRFGIAAS